jgi:hypothetical protein
MKSALTRGLALLLAMLGSLGGVPQAYAAAFQGRYTNYPGAVCRNNNPEDAGTISYRWGAISSSKESSTYILCPLTRPVYYDYNEGGYIQVFIGHTGPLYVEQTTMCTVSSVDYDGQVLASDTQSWTGTGSSKLDFVLYGTGKSSHTSTYSVLCLIPGYTQGAIYSIQLDQFERID